MRSLDYWFNPDKEQNLHPFEKYKYFYLVWSKKTKTAKWIENKPKIFNFEKSVNLRLCKKNYSIKLLGYFSKQIDDNPFRDLDAIEKQADYVEFSNSALLKSVIQKAIRRKNTNLAILASFHLMRLDLQVFLRRIIIIALEDSSLHVDLSICVWLMLSYPHHNKFINSNIIQYLLGIVYFISNNNTYLEYKPNIPLIIPNDIREYPNYNLCLSLLTRRLYGGMKGDMNMIDTIVQKLFLGDINLSNINIKINRIKIDTYLSLESIPHYSLDFHCFPRILKELANIHKSYNESYIKKLIWTHSSSINTRNKNRCKQNINDWNKIKYDFERLIRNHKYKNY